MDYREFASKIKAKYPDYADMDDRALAQKIISKYPQDYGDVTFDEPRDAVAQPTADPNFEVGVRTAPTTGTDFGNQNLPSNYTAALPRPITALLTNEPTRGIVEPVLRKLPAMTGAAVAGAAAETAGVAASPFTLGLSVPAGHVAAITAAGIGGAGMEAARQGAAQVYSSFTGTPYTPPGEVAKNVGVSALEGAGGQAFTSGAKVVGEAAASRLPAFIEHYFGPQSAITRYIQSRGAGKVLTSENINPEAPMNALEGARDAVVGGRKAAGSAVGAAEDAIIESGKAAQPLNVADIALDLRQAVEKAGLIGQDAKALNPGQVKQLEYVLNRLEGGVTSQEAIQLKRMLGELIDTGGGRIPEVGKRAAGLIETTVGKLAGRINSTHPELGAANAAMTKVVKVYNRYRKFLGQMGDEAFQGGDDALQMVADEAALRRIRSALASNPKVPAAAVAEFDEALAGAGPVLEKLFDTAAANMFNTAKAGRGAPSNILLKGASSIGLTSPYMAGQILRGAEAVSKVSPTAAGFGAAAALSPLAEAYMRQSR